MRLSLQVLVLLPSIGNCPGRAAALRQGPIVKATAVTEPKHAGIHYPKRQARHNQEVRRESRACRLRHARAIRTAMQICLSIPSQKLQGTISPLHLRQGQLHRLPLVLPSTPQGAQIRFTANWPIHSNHQGRRASTCSQQRMQARLQGPFQKAIGVLLD
jgi:hypothetical protein